MPTGFFGTNLSTYFAGSHVCDQRFLFALEQK